MGQIADYLMNYTCSVSQFETERNYLSISHCGLSIEDQWKQWKEGFKLTPEVGLKCYKGYQMEADLKKRMRAAFPTSYAECPEISAFNGLVKGHPDFTFDSNPADFKSVTLDEYLPKVKLPRKVYWQMQGYMLYSNTNRALVIYESRESGKIIDWWLVPNKSIQEEIHTNFTILTNRIKNEN